MIRRASILLLLVFYSFAEQNQAAKFKGVGYLSISGGGGSSVAHGVSGSGNLVVGVSSADVPFPTGIESGPIAFRWTAGTPITGLRDLPTVDPVPPLLCEAMACSAFGEVIVGYATPYAYPDYTTVAVRWTSKGIERFDQLPDWPRSVASCVSADGSVAVGWMSNTLGTGSGTTTQDLAVAWTPKGIKKLDDLPGGPFLSRATGVSADGTFIVGCGYSDHSGPKALLWIPSESRTINLYEMVPENYSSRATAISSRKAAVVGYAQKSGVANTEVAVLWTARGAIPLGPLSGIRSSATDVTADGSKVIGWYKRTDEIMRPFIWDRMHGMRDLQSVLSSEYGLTFPDWELKTANAISDSGLTIVGHGMHTYLGTTRREGWWVNLFEVPTATPIGGSIKHSWNAPNAMDRREKQWDHAWRRLGEGKASWRQSFKQPRKAHDKGSVIEGD